MQRAFVYQDANGVRRTLIADDERPDQFVVKTEQDIEPVLESVARDRELMAHNGDNRVIGRFPVEVFERMIHEGWGPDDEARYYNSPEAARFRIWKGRV
jgi:hypothetical protein